MRPVPAEETILIERAEKLDHQLIRAIGIPALTANIVNSTIGAGIFVLPALVAKGLGGAAPLGFGASALCIGSVVPLFSFPADPGPLTRGVVRDFSSPVRLFRRVVAWPLC